ncbi:hypothetical protein J6590_097356 [Homalodisca vitripennis]|nr:hypothetical protein J6590_097356 [Homalodisca vitripennis]
MSAVSLWVGMIERQRQMRHLADIDAKLTHSPPLVTHHVATFCSLATSSRLSHEYCHSTAKVRDRTVLKLTMSY